LWNLRAGASVQWQTTLFDRDEYSFVMDAKFRADKQAVFVSTNEKYEFRFHKAYLQWQGNRASVALGLQKVTWGDSAFFDGVDFVNPRDLTEPLFSDDEQMKLPVPALNLQYLGENTIFQTILTFKPVRSPVGDDIENIPVESPDEHLWIHDLEVAFKAGGLLKSGWDINGYLLSYFERIPQPIFKFPASPPAAGVPPTRGNSNQPVGSVSAVTLRLNEPRVFTLGLTATQSAGDYVYRGELALHTNRALPDVPSTKASLADQAVFHGTTDVTFFKNLLTTFEVWGEHWFAATSERFKPKSVLVGMRLQKPYFDGRLEPSAGALISPDGRESWSFIKVQCKPFGSAQLSGEAHWAETSTGRVLARRGLKNLVRSSLSYQF